MAAEVPDSFSLYWLILILSAATCLFLHHAIKIYLHHGCHQATIVTDSLSLLLIAFAIIGTAVFIVTILIPPDHLFCTFAAHYKASGYSLFKATLYCILILRCDTAFKASSVEYSRWKLEAWAITLLFWSLNNLAGINLTASTIEGTCKAEKPPLVIIISVGLLDLVSCVVNTALFSRPLFKLHRNMVLHQCSPAIRGSNLKEHSLKTLALKQCILSLIAICSTMFSLITLALFQAYYISISFDYLVGSLCIILMYSWNTSLLEALCCCIDSGPQPHPGTKLSKMGKAQSVPSHSAGTVTSRSKPCSVTSRLEVPSRITRQPSLIDQCSVNSTGSNHSGTSGEQDIRFSQLSVPSSGSAVSSPAHSMDPSTLEDIKTFFHDAEQVDIDHIPSPIVPSSVSPDRISPNTMDKVSKIKLVNLHSVSCEDHEDHLDERDAPLAVV